MRKTVLFVVTSTADLGSTGAKTGAWLEELAAPYAVFEDAGFQSLIASTAGGAAPLDPASLEKPWITPKGERFLTDPQARAKMDGSHPVGSITAAEVDAVFVVGGTGTMWDFPHSAELGNLLTDVHALGKPVAAVCHGVVALLTAKDAGGNPLAAGRRLTCFSNAEESLLEFDKIVPFLAETALRDQGANYSAAEPFAEHVVRDGLVLTGQNPASAAPLAEAVVQFLLEQDR